MKAEISVRSTSHEKTRFGHVFLDSQLGWASVPNTMYTILSTLCSSQWVSGSRVYIPTEHVFASRLSRSVFASCLLLYVSCLLLVFLVAFCFLLIAFCLLLTVSCLPDVYSKRCPEIQKQQKQIGLLPCARFQQPMLKTIPERSLQDSPDPIPVFPRFSQ